MHIVAKTIHITVKRVSSENIVTTNLTKRIMKKLSKDAWLNTAFTFNDKIHKQIDRVSMVSLLDRSYQMFL